MFRVNCLQKDKPGIVAEVFKRVYPLNIALAETVKLEKGDLHQVSLICEPTSDEQDVLKQITRIKNELKTSGFELQVKRLPPLPELAWNRAGQVEHGWVKGVKWTEEISSKYSRTVEKADLKRVVVSADTESRVLRYVFPRCGAMTVSIKHADEPGALAEITKALRSCSLNILSAFLRRGGGRGLDAELVAVCEPEDKVDIKEIGSLKKTVKEQISKIHQRFRPQLFISDGRDAEEAIYCRHPEEVVARVPDNLSWPVQKIRRQLREGADSSKKINIFISRRFPEQSQGLSRMVADVRQTLRDNGCVPVEAEPTMGRDPNTIYTEVSSKMWASKAGIVLIIKVPDNKPISLNLAHELGFLQGQGKRVLVLVENEPECKEVMSSFTNFAGVVFQSFDPKLDKDNPKSVQSAIKEWLKVVNNDLGIS
jgi:predicted amino acid-binding ACT domain protein